MLDYDLAEIYQVPTKRLNEAVKRNIYRFPQDFMFQLSKLEFQNWKSQFATSNASNRMGLRKVPHAFTELGIAMLSSVLNSKSAINMNILIMRAFVTMRYTLASNASLAEKMNKIERRQQNQEVILIGVVNDIKKLKNPPLTRAIGFRVK